MSGANWRAARSRRGGERRTDAEALTPAQERILAELRQTHDEDFDAAYVRIAETDYERVLEAFQDAGGSADPRIASRSMPFGRISSGSAGKPPRISALPGTF